MLVSSLGVLINNSACHHKVTSNPLSILFGEGLQLTPSSTIQLSG